MKLISTLSYALSGNVAGKGNYGGDLRLFFSHLNPADWKATPAPISWQTAGGSVADSYNLPSGDTIGLHLNLIADVPGRIYIFGPIQVTTAGGGSYGPPVGQAASQLFVPGAPVIATLQGRSQGTQGAVQFDTGFELIVPWDGTSADCYGRWWAVWH